MKTDIALASGGQTSCLYLPESIFSYFDDKFIYFEHLEAHHSSKYLMMAFCIISILVSSPLTMVLINFEKNGNRLLTDR